MLALHELSKSFPGVKALEAVSLTINAGQIHALVGENGAGKSTLIKIVTGIYQPDAGQIYLDGCAIRFPSFQASLNAGIRIVNQEIQVIPDASVAENILLDQLAAYSYMSRINWHKINAKAEALMDQVGLDIAPTTPTRGLSAAQKQLIQIAKALAGEAKVLFLDEPTSALTPHETKRLFDVLGELKQVGVAIVFVSHKLEEVYQIAQRVSVLRDGHHIDTRTVEGLRREELIRMMIGREYDDSSLGVLARGNHVALKAVGLSSPKINGVDFLLYEGEVLGFYGLVGSGRTEVARALIGADPLSYGRVEIDGQVVQIDAVATALYQHGIGYVTENRKEEGLFLEASIQTNIGLTVWPRLRHWLSRCISAVRERTVVEAMVKALDIKMVDPDQHTVHLSGGNQQKVSLAKWLAAGCRILIIDEPSVGIDVGAKGQLHRLVRELATEEGKAIIVISSDMPEIIRLASRILIFKEKRIVAEIVDVQGKDYAAVSDEIGHCLN